MTAATGWTCPSCRVTHAPWVAHCDCFAARTVKFTFCPPLPPLQPCAFDNLPPGVYGLVCPCPRCTPRMTVNAGGSVLAPVVLS